jgi:hypothetical protein
MNLTADAAVFAAPAPAAVLPASLLANARVLPRRDDILPMLPKHAVFAEVGVAFGEYSRVIREICDPASFIAIDNFCLHEFDVVWGKTREERFGALTHEAYFRRDFAAEIESGAIEVMAGDSVAMLERLPDASLDVVYLDADHSYDSVARELAVIARKVREDGWIVLNDYTMMDAGGAGAPYGVVQAAHEFMIAQGWEMVALALHPLMYCDVALRKAR